LILSSQTIETHVLGTNGKRDWHDITLILKSWAKSICIISKNGHQNWHLSMTKTFRKVLSIGIFHNLEHQL
jgi:hypothetical protein